MMPQRKAFPAVALALSLGCGDGNDRQEPVMTMVTECTPVTSVPDSSGGQIGSFAVGPGGYIAWTDRAIGNHIIIGTPDSILLVGRDGSGPGEFRMIAGIGWRGDTVWASDLKLQRFQEFSATGDLIRSVPVPVRATFAWVAGDTLIGLPVQSVADSAYPILRYLQDRTGADTLAVFRHPKVPPLEIRMSDQAIVGPQPFAERVTAARSPDDRRWCALEPGAEPAMRLVCGAPDGRRLLDTVIAVPGQPLGKEDVAEVLDRFGEIPGLSREKLEAAPHVPRYLPRVDRMMIADDGRIWLLLRSSNDSAPVWQRLAPDGTSEGSVTLLPTQRALLLLGDSLYVAAADENDVQHIERCSL